MNAHTGCRNAGSGSGRVPKHAVRITQARWIILNKQTHYAHTPATASTADFFGRAAQHLTAPAWLKSTDHSACAGWYPVRRRNQWQLHSFPNECQVTHLQTYPMPIKLLSEQPSVNKLKISSETENDTTLGKITYHCCCRCLGRHGGREDWRRLNE